MNWIDACGLSAGDGDGAASLKTARSMLYDAVKFIQDNTITIPEQITAATLTKLMNDKKVQFDHMIVRGESKNTYGFFDPRRNTVTGISQNIIVADISNTISKGMAELVDTLSHEAYHAAHRFANHRNNLIAEEIYA